MSSQKPAGVPPGNRCKRSTLVTRSSLKAAVEKLSKQDGTSINQFVVMAVAEKVSALQTATFFEERRALGERDVFRRVVNRSGGEQPRAGDEADSPR